MAIGRGDGLRSDVAIDRAQEIAARARRRGGETGRLRLHQLEIIIIIAVQCGLSAAVSWEIAHRVLGHPAPVFAPSAAVGTIVAALGQRVRRAVELLVGVALGLLISDVLLLLAGVGPWQTGLVVALAIATALLMTGRSGALVAQTGSSAILIATLSSTVGTLEVPRIVEAGVGGMVGLLVVGLLLPINPMRVLDRAAAPVVDTLSAQLQEVTRALVERCPDRAVRALDHLRGMEPDLARLHEALGGAEEVVTIAPARWHRRHDVERYRCGIEHMDRVVIECQQLARWTVTSLQSGEPVPQELPTAVQRLAETVQLMRQESREGRPPTRIRQAALDVACLAGQACARDPKRYAEAMLTQLQTVASDLFRATGYDPDTANRLVRAAAQDSAGRGAE